MVITVHLQVAEMLVLAIDVQSDGLLWQSPGAGVISKYEKMAANVCKNQ